ncbi:MAG: hypothetical protein KTR32_05450 [Granulosicoccus sp.]|nr:hypothetical protein [Granulosicoccus sp.]
MSMSDVNMLGSTDIETTKVVSLAERRQALRPAGQPVGQPTSQPASQPAERSESKTRVGSANAGYHDSPSASLPPAEFKLLTFLDQMNFKASIEIDDLVWIRGHFSARIRDQIVAMVRKLLCQEFGRNMIQRDELIFIVRHRSAEALITGLLRVQFYANQIVLPEFNIFGERVDQNGVSVTWGVGRTAEEAGIERVKKRKRRNLRRR